ncbi:phosphoglycerate kinase [Candidatus Dependentiae bacterium]
MSNKNINIKDTFFLSNAINKIDFKNKQVFLRVDLNVPIINQDKNKAKAQKILSDHKFLAILPTIQMLLKKGAKIVVATHLSNPKKPDKSLSTEILLPMFEKHGYKVSFEPDLDKAIQESATIFKRHNILLLENLRFFKGEKNKKFAPEFAQKLTQLGDYYVNDAFGVLHREDTSITLVPELFGKQNIFLGLLVEHELHMLEKLCAREHKKFTCIIGGGKVDTKLPLIQYVLDKVDKVLLCPAINFTFLKYAGKQVGNSLVDDSLLPLIPKILRKAKNKKVKIVYPVDYIVAKDSFEGPISIIDKNEIPDGFVGVSIGPKTTKKFTEIISNSKTVFFNGAPGNIKNIKTLQGTMKMFKAMGKRGIFSVISGGDSVAIAYLTGAAQNIDYLSTGGGATLTFFSNQKLPGLAIFQSKDHQISQKKG